MYATAFVLFPSAAIYEAAVYGTPPEFWPPRVERWCVVGAAGQIVDGPFVDEADAASACRLRNADPDADHYDAILPLVTAGLAGYAY